MQDNNKMNHELEPLLTSHQECLARASLYQCDMHVQKVLKNARTEFEKAKERDFQFNLNCKMCLPAPCCVVISKSGNIRSHEVHSANYYNSTLSMFIQISVSTI